MTEVHLCILLLRLQVLNLRHCSAIKPTHKLVDNLMVMVLKLTEDVKLLCKDNCCKLFLKLYNHELMTHYEENDQQVLIQMCKCYIF